MSIFSAFERTCGIESVIELFAKGISGKRLLEIGSGAGARTVIFKNAGCKITGIDIIDVRKIGLAAGYDFIIADGRCLPFKDEAFDAVASFDVIEHIDRDDLFLNEAFRVCKKGGNFILGTPSRERFSNRLRQMLGKRLTYPLKLGDGCIHLREYTMEKLIDAVKKVGFNVIKEKHFWFGVAGIGGFKYMPRFLNKWAQYLFVFATRPRG